MYGDDPRALGVHLLDLVAIAAFLYLGELRHGTDPVVYPVRYLGTLAPFLVGWVAVVAAVVLLGVDGLGDGLRGRVATGAALWLPVAAIGLALRASPSFHGGAPVSFVAVTAVGGAAMVAVVRAATWWLGR